MVLSYKLDSCYFYDIYFFKLQNRFFEVNNMAGNVPPVGSLQQFFLKELLALKPRPLRYNGCSDPELAETWLRLMNKYMNALDVPAEIRVPLATFFLEKDAWDWWEFASRGTDLERFTWEDFQRRYLDMFCLETYRALIRNLFAGLNQGEYSVAKYAMEFIQLSRFEFYIMKESDKIEMFISGLSAPIQSVMRRERHENFEDLVNKARRVERNFERQHMGG